VESHYAAIAKSVIQRIEVGVLTGNDQRGPQIKSSQRTGERRKLDRLGPRADNQPDIRAMQISP
jgi:hypothetical protein